MKHPGRKILLIFLSLGALAFLFLFIEHLRGRWMLDRWKGRMASSGEILDIEKLAPPLVPPEENRLPQLIFVASQMSGFSFLLYPPTSRYAAPGKVVVISKLNDWPEFDATKTTTSWVQVAGQLAPIEPQIGDALELLQSGHFGANLHYESGFNQPIAHLQRLKSLVQIFSAAALHDLHQQHVDAAFEKLKAMLAVVQVEKDEPILISQLVRIAMMHLAFATTWQALQHDGWTDSQLAQLQRNWGDLGFLRQMEKSMLMERAIAPIEYERFRTSDLPLSELLDTAGIISVGGSRPSLLSWDWISEIIKNVPLKAHDYIYTPIWKFAWSHHDERHYNDFMRRVIVAHRETCVENSGSNLAAKLNSINDAPLSLYDRIRFAVAPTMYGSLVKLFERAWFAQARVELAITAIAIKRYQLRHGELPGCLDDLVPELLPKCPTDYMDGRQLKYCLDHDSFLLYSVGIDGKDDGGDDRDVTGRITNFQNARDLVWPRPASEEEVLAWKASRK